MGARVCCSGWLVIATYTPHKPMLLPLQNKCNTFLSVYPTNLIPYSINPVGAGKEPFEERQLSHYSGLWAPSSAF